MSWNDPANWPAGMEPTSAFLHAQVRDNLKALTEYQPYVPVLGSDGAQPTTSVAQGGFISAGDWRSFWARFVIATAGTGTYTVSLPSTAARVYCPGINGHFLDLSGVAPYTLNAINFSTTAIRFTHRTGNFLTATSPVAPAAGDEIVIGGVFESA